MSTDYAGKGKCKTDLLNGASDSPLTDHEPSHLVLQGRTLKTQAFGRSAVTRDLPGRRLQCLEDDFPLGFMEGRGVEAGLETV